MATNLAIDNKLIEEARTIGQHRTKKAVVTEALREFREKRRISWASPFFSSKESN